MGTPVASVIAVNKLQKVFLAFDQFMPAVVNQWRSEVCCDALSKMKCVLLVER
jgi:hypothetical protein